MDRDVRLIFENCETFYGSGGVGRTLHGDETAHQLFDTEGHLEFCTVGVLRVRTETASGEPYCRACDFLSRW